MVIIAKRALTDYAAKHSDTIVALMEWYDIVSEADWSNVNQVKQTFNSADYVGNERFVFNRLVVIDYQSFKDREKFHKAAQTPII